MIYAVVPLAFLAAFLGAYLGATFALRRSPKPEPVDLAKWVEADKRALASKDTTESRHMDEWAEQQVFMASQGGL
ncbi:MAG TPA: hypothetical protein VFR02_10095 [bacterium]|nr:hypothetical protein [bacterium]